MRCVVIVFRWNDKEMSLFFYVDAVLYKRFVFVCGKDSLNQEVFFGLGGQLSEGMVGVR